MRWTPQLTKGALLVMESMWVYALVIFFVAITVGGGRPTPFGAAAVVFASFAISRVLQLSELSLGALRLWGMLLSFLVFYAIVRVDFFGDFRFYDFGWVDDLFGHTEASLENESNAVIAIPLLWGFWVRGVLRGQQHTGFENVLGSFGVGLVVVAIVQLLAPDRTPAAVDYVAVPYVALGLMAVALANAARAEEEYGRSYGATWLITVGGLIAVASLIALVFVVLDFDGVRSGLGTGGKAIGTVIAYIAYGILYPFVILTEWILGPFGDLLQKAFGGDSPADREPLEEPEQLLQDDTPGQAPYWLRLLMRALVGSSFVTLIVFSTYFLFTRFKRRLGPSEVRESTYQEGRLGADVGGLLGNLIGRLRPRHGGGANLDAVHRLYFDMLNAGADRGIERRPAETPLELAPRLDTAFKATTPGEITGAFDEAHYGGLSPSPEEIERLRREWEASKR